MPTAEQEIVLNAQAQLMDGECRLTPSAAPFSESWFPDDDDDDDDGDDELDAGRADVREEWSNEMDALRSVLKTITPIPVITRNDRPAYSIGFDRDMQIADASRKIWNYYAFPYRRRGDTVYYIRTNPMYQAFIRSCDLEVFLQSVARKTANDAASLRSLDRSRDVWRAWSIFAGIGLALSLLAHF